MHVATRQAIFAALEMVFRSAYKNSEAVSGEVKQNELSKLAGKLWSKMSEEERRPFRKRAETEKVEYKAKYPGCTYSPGRNDKKSKPGASVKKRKTSKAVKDNRPSLTNTF